MRVEQINSLTPDGLAQLANLPALADDFITTVSRLSPAGHPDVLLTEASYDPVRYSDQLFARYLLPFPTHLAKAVAKRRAEYLASRVCVRETLSLFGFSDFLLTNDADRAPIWPPGVAGSLSHTRTCVSLMLTTASAGKQPGVDCEEIMLPAAAAEMEEMIINKREYAVLQRSGLPFATALTAAFSLKESLYKALFPLFRQFMDFKEAEIVACEAEMASVTLRLNRALSPDFAVGRLFSGHVTLHERTLTSWVMA